MGLQQRLDQAIDDLNRSQERELKLIIDVNALKYLLVQSCVDKDYVDFIRGRSIFDEGELEAWLFTVKMRNRVLETYKNLPDGTTVRSS